ncbi:TetR/AcrR family transcriptional regulator [Hwanghaeella grinnelliae]|uniref:TetR/AcrR family transcriptional regulator n=1 Tax=Hwanghaeella grinnelliae TaxID=2500179 RepID=A0A3S2VRN2_9PROT|nr:TetR/AcrR family transcriptional regulator [Hwanghaeella grinnelliae]RVU38869.1 TetR/AcrR family transcriptional regulator [Hwanghaeella grinnelliae]
MAKQRAPKVQDLTQERAGALREERRAAIIEAAKSVFMRNGLEKASMRTIATEANCTTGAIYPYFQGKEEIYGAVLTESLDLLQDYIRTCIAAAETPPARARAGLTAFYDYYQDRPDELALGLYLFQGLGPNGLTKELDRALNAQLADLFTLLTDACAKAGLPDPAKTAGGGIAQAVGTLVLERTGRIRLVGQSSQDLMYAFLDQAFAGLQATP